MGSKTIDCPVVGFLHRREPHGGNVLLQQLRNLPAGIDLLGIGIQKHLHHHFRVIGASSTAFIVLVENIILNGLDHAVDDTGNMMFRDQSLKVEDSHALLVVVRDKHWFEVVAVCI